MYVEDGYVSHIRYEYLKALRHIYVQPRLHPFLNCDMVGNVIGFIAWLLEVPTLIGLHGYVDVSSLLWIDSVRLAKLTHLYFKPGCSIPSTLRNNPTLRFDNTTSVKLYGRTGSSHDLDDSLWMSSFQNLKHVWIIPASTCYATSDTVLPKVQYLAMLLNRPHIEQIDIFPEVPDTVTPITAKVHTTENRIVHVTLGYEKDGLVVVPRTAAANVGIRHIELDIRPGRQNSQLDTLNLDGIIQFCYMLTHNVTLTHEMGTM